VSLGKWKGTAGVVRWPIYGVGRDRILSVMWSIPYNMQFWSAWAAVGLSGGGDDQEEDMEEEAPPDYEELYSGNDDERFARAKAGRDFEFSDSERFLVKATMDGGGKSKPVLRVGLIPLADADLAEAIRAELGVEDADGGRPDVTKAVADAGSRESGDGSVWPRAGLVQTSGGSHITSFRFPLAATAIVASILVFSEL